MTEQVKPLVLVAEDTLDRRDVLRKILSPVAILTFADSALQAIAEIRRNQYDFIFLDHDLGVDEINGSDVAACVYLSKNAMTPVLVHSVNADGAARMVRTLNLFSPGPIVAVPFSSSIFAECAVGFIQGTWGWEADRRLHP